MDRGGARPFIGPHRRRSEPARLYLAGFVPLRRRGGREEEVFVDDEQSGLFEREAAGGMAAVFRIAECLGFVFQRVAGGDADGFGDEVAPRPADGAASS